jgi:hypothetical protein
MTSSPSKRPTEDEAQERGSWFVFAFLALSIELMVLIVLAHKIGDW